MIKVEQVGSLKVELYGNRQLLGVAAGKAAAQNMRERLAKQQHIRMIFAAAPSQLEFLSTLVQEPGIDWSRVTAFHMDEYIGLEPKSEQSFSGFLSTHLFDIVKPGKVHLINGAGEAKNECLRYRQLLLEEKIDIVCLGIGENGHIAFNDPPVADFGDKEAVKVVELEQVCRMQQVHDGCFLTLDAVPTHAITLTIPTLFSGESLFCVVPGMTKRQAVHQTLRGEITTACPATILRRHPNCTLYVDRDSYGG